MKHNQHKYIVQCQLCFDDVFDCPVERRSHTEHHIDNIIDYIDYNYGEEVIQDE